ncbi:MAG TPA: aminotransferase class III-fold pyridoxal phosphate-dependent enzyme [Myxococcota bacterium]|nr:aminotransferase class III-fold pyridoxal phosphate-dependent enzyme [Myxococcota bacterium]
MNNLNEQAKLYGQSVMIPWSKQGAMEAMMVKEASGVYLTLANGKKLLDMKSQAFYANLGHNHQGMIAAMVQAAGAGSIVGSDSYCEDRLGLALDLKRIAPTSSSVKLTKAFYTLGGAEANENAIKIARMFTKRHKIITRYRSYHGATIATMNFSGDYRRIPIDNAITGVVRFPDPHPRNSGQTIDTVRLLEEIIEVEGAETIAAIMLEGITGANGVFIPPKDYWPRIRKICDETGIVLIADEVLSGFFRTGAWFGVSHFDVVPDIITMSKGLTAGYAPLGALLIRQEIADHFESETLWCGLTQYGHPLSCAAARAAIGFYESDHIKENVAARGQELGQMLDALSRDHKMVQETRSLGLLAAIDLKKGEHDEQPLVHYRATGKDLEPTIILQKLLREAGISTVVRYSTILLSPPLIISSSELKDGMLAIDRALKELLEHCRSH